jgi:hypothetical protein
MKVATGVSGGSTMRPIQLPLSSQPQSPRRQRLLTQGSRRLLFPLWHLTKIVEALSSGHKRVSQ